MHICNVLEGSPNWYGSGLENRRAQALGGSSPPPSAPDTLTYKGVRMSNISQEPAMIQIRSSTLLAGCVVALILSACQSGTTNPSTPTNYYPMAQGNYWIYDTYQLDTTGNRVGEPQRDSAVMGAPMNIDGRQAYPVYTYHQDGSVDTSYMAKDAEGNVYMYLDISAEDEGLPGLPQLGRRWVMIAATQSTSSWTVLDTTVSNVDIGGGFVTNLQLEITGEKGGTQQVTVGTTSYNAQTSSLKVEIKTTPIQLISLQATNTWFMVANIGPAKSRSIITFSSPIPIPGLAGGSESVLVRYSVK